MEDPDNGAFGERVAATYDDADGAGWDPDEIAATVDLLAGLAGTGRALEFAVGTGRIALPLAARGVPVVGIELSRAMVARLLGKPGGEELPVVLGDMATSRADGRFALVYLVFNTIMNLTSQEAQVACFRNAAAHLEPGGSFLVECMVPQLRRLPPGRDQLVYDVSDDRWSIDEYDIVRQGLVSHHMKAVEGRLERIIIPFRYVWPSELDLMAELAGMHLRARWASWRRDPFSADSERHVSVWERPG